MATEARSQHIKSKSRSLVDSINFENQEDVDATLLKYRQIIEKGTLVKLDPSLLKTNENIRKSIDEDSREFKQLVDSIKRYGILQSIIVEYRETSNKTFDLVCVSGHRRLEALKRSGLKEKIPAKLVSFERKGASVGIALSENVNRQNLHFIELADSYQYLQKNENVSTAELAARFDKNERTVSTYLKMATWPIEAKSIILENQGVFPLRYVWDNFAKKNIATGQLPKTIEAKAQNRRS